MSAATINICHACKEDQEKTGKPIRRLLEFKLDPFTYTPIKKANSDLPKRDTEIPLWLCPYCDQHTIAARAESLNQDG